MEKDVQSIVHFRGPRKVPGPAFSRKVRLFHRKVALPRHLFPADAAAILDSNPACESHQYYPDAARGDECPWPQTKDPHRRRRQEVTPRDEESPCQTVKLHGNTADNV